MSKHFITEKKKCTECGQNIITQIPIEDMVVDMEALVVRQDKGYELILTSHSISKIVPEGEISIVVDTLTELWEHLMSNLRFAKYGTAISIASLQGNFSIHRRLDTNPALAEEMREEFLAKITGDKKYYTKMSRQAY